MSFIINTIKELLDTPIGKGFGFTVLLSLGTAVVTKIRKKYSWLEFLNYWFISCFIGILLYLILVYGFNLNMYLVLGINNLVALFIYSILDEIDEALKDLNVILTEALKNLLASLTSVLKSKIFKNKQDGQDNDQQD